MNFFNVQVNPLLSYEHYEVIYSRKEGGGVIPMLIPTFGYIFSNHDKMAKMTTWRSIGAILTKSDYGYTATLKSVFQTFKNVLLQSKASQVKNHT